MQRIHNDQLLLITGTHSGLIFLFVFVSSLIRPRYPYSGFKVHTRDIREEQYMFEGQFG